ncbi:MAG: amino acid ABC transporter permease [Rhodobacteraceae bacterium]|nr:amino acid ABC transporter permease [Paracoccaceae bacterium]RZO39233.1 MAG: amino acid ABC transporter permease [Paracoccaceae bacterium]|tara:strand:- start:5822 stop:7510 length:1689 start_codon:yes stop_codon:yes gene_type:complete
MQSILDRLRSIRASNLIFLAVAPILIYLIFSSRNYAPALYSVLGIEENAGSLFLSFLLLVSAGMFGLIGSISLSSSTRPDLLQGFVERYRKRAMIFFIAQLVLLVVLAFFEITDNYFVSVAINSADPRTVDWIIMSDKSFILEPNFQSALLENSRTYLKLLVVFNLFSLAFVFLKNSLHKSLFMKSIIALLVLINFSGMFYVLMIAHAGFAVGIMITLRAAFFAYIGASILGLVWALLVNLKPSRRSSYTFSILGISLILLGIFYTTRPHEEIVLAGTLEGKIGIVAGTPQSVTDIIRYGEFQNLEGAKSFKIRSMATTEQALTSLEKGRVSAIVIEADKVGNLPILWSTDYLSKFNKTMATIGFVLGGLSILLMAIGLLTNAHPLAVFSDFFVDTIRGIPMLVIILYVGLPLAGAIKSASAGLIDMQMMTRGIIAIAIGYSAYMAEIFRAGIEAIPKGQIEAARTLGLREWHVARFVIVPQAIAIVLPALGNEFIAMLKDTSLVSILSVRDLTQRMREFQAQSFLVFEPFNSAALVYLLLTLIAASGIKSLDKIINKGRSD